MTSIGPRCPCDRGRGAAAVLALWVGLWGLGFAREGRADPPADRKAGDREPNKGAHHSRLVVVRVGGDDEGRSVVVLGKPTGTVVYQETFGNVQGLLVRELARQAILIAARDELGLSTRDELLGEASPARGDGAPVDLITDFHEDAGRLLIRRGGDEKAPLVFDRDMGPDSQGAPGTLTRFAVFVESLSRTEFPVALKALGLEGTPNMFRAEAGLPKGVEAHLGALGFVENMAAVRELHAAIRADGESPARLGALARGYAQLGALSEFHWHPAHKAFKTRALLYAQRLVARRPDDPQGLWHRAYVEALLGLSALARADLDEASRRARASDQNMEAPAWVELLDAFLGGRLDRLKADRGPHVKLAALLRLMAVEFPAESVLALEAARDVVALDAECYRAHEALCRAGGLANLHAATAHGPEALAQLFPNALGALPDLPPKVREALKLQAGEVPVVEALARSGTPGDDPREPSWGVLAHLIRETRFVQVYRRLSFLHDTWGVPVDEFWAAARPSVERHRDFPFLEVFVRPKADVLPSLTDYVDRLDRTDLEVTAFPMVRWMGQFRIPKSADLRAFATSHADPVARDLALVLEWPGRDSANVAARLLEVDPRSSFAMASLIAADWDGVKDHVPEWRKVVDDAPALLAALATHYTATKQLDEARDVLTRYIARCPDSWGYSRLADNFKARGDEGRWKATLDESLEKVTDHGLEHASIRVKIAEEFMRQKRWADARPYAEAAAESWAPWAVTCAARCAEGMEDWPRAESWLRRGSEHNPRACADWYRFCLRTGRGDVKSAQARAQQSVAELEGRRNPVDLKTAAYYYWVTGALRKAQGVLTKLVANDPDEVSAILHLALIADEMDEPRRRDEMLETIWTKYQGQAPRAAQVCRTLRHWLVDGERGNPDLAFVDKQLASLAPGLRGDLEFFLGRFLVLHGKPELGRPYLIRCHSDPAADEWFRAIARQSMTMPALAPLP